MIVLELPAKNRPVSIRSMLSRVLVIVNKMKPRSIGTVSPIKVQRRPILLKSRNATGPEMTEPIRKMVPIQEAVDPWTLLISQLSWQISLLILGNAGDVQVIPAPNPKEPNEAGTKALIIISNKLQFNYLPEPLELEVLSSFSVVHYLIFPF